MIMTFRTGVLAAVTAGFLVSVAPAGDMAGRCSGRTINPALERNYADAGARIIGEHFGIAPSDPGFPYIFLGVADRLEVDPEALPRWRSEVRVAFAGPDADLAEAIVTGMFDQIAVLVGSTFHYRIVPIQEANVIVHAGMAREEQGRRDFLEPMFDQLEENIDSVAEAWIAAQSVLSGESDESVPQEDAMTEPRWLEGSQAISIFKSYKGCQSTVVMNDRDIVAAIVESSSYYDSESANDNVVYSRGLSLCLWTTTAHMMGALGYRGGLPNWADEIFTDPSMVTIALSSGLSRYSFSPFMCAAFTKYGVRVMDRLYRVQEH